MGDVSANARVGAGPVDEMKARIEAERGDRPFLHYRDGDDRQQLFPLEPGATKVSVGRQPSSDLVLGWDDHVSRSHARFERVEDGWTVVDDGRSRNGTFLNGERVTGRRHLKDGDSVRFGVTTVTFRSPRGDERAEAAPAGEAPPAVDLSSTQRRVLMALCRPYAGGNAFASPTTDQQIADELFLAVGAVKTHLTVLFAKFGVGELPHEQRRIRLVERAFSSGVVSERDL